jgi:single-stranded DNA-binding protein
MNKVVLIGRLIRDPELKFIPDNNCNSNQYSFIGGNFNDKIALVDDGDMLF